MKNRPCYDAQKDWSIDLFLEHKHVQDFLYLSLDSQEDHAITMRQPVSSRQVKTTINENNASARLDVNALVSV